jgi:hypothetical protein
MKSTPPIYRHCKEPPPPEDRWGWSHGGGDLQGRQNLNLGLMRSGHAFAYEQTIAKAMNGRNALRGSWPWGKR